MLKPQHLSQNIAIFKKSTINKANQQKNFGKLLHNSDFRHTFANEIRNGEDSSAG